jgi:S-formylglutathione hydrolase FrmB
MTQFFKIGLAMLAILLSAPGHARMEKHSVYSPSVAGNLEGNSAERTVYVFLPPSYDKTKKRHYPVIYFLHGFNSTPDDYLKRVTFNDDLKGVGKATHEMIVVVPDSYTKWGGSMYSNSPTIGNFEDFIATDLIRWVDAQYRTLARRESRGIAGHSMGGYGALKLGMKHPDIFGALYAMNPCCMIPRPASLADLKFETMTVEQALKAPWMERGNFAVASAWSPNPNKPPFYSDLGTKDGKPDTFVVAQWAANSPAAMAAAYLPALKSLAGIAIDTGDTDFVKDDDILIHDVLTKFGVAHDWEIYVGDHGNKMPERFRTHVLPFFTKHLKAKP